MPLHWKLSLYHPSVPQNKAPYVTSLSKSILEKGVGYAEKTMLKGIGAKKNMPKA
jgi:hypothetical protein